MTDEEINIAIAEACGWKRCRSPMQSNDDPEPRGWQSPTGNRWVNGIPRYVNDLNAMHEAEKILDDEDQNAYANEISYRFTKTYEWDYDPKDSFRLVHATARQRAEAFLRTLEKWK